MMWITLEERIAKLVDGRLHGLARDTLVAQFAVSPLDYLLYANTAWLVREMGEEP